MKLWLAPRGMHVEPGETGDAGDLARLHAAAFYRGWPESEFTAWLADPAVTPCYVLADGKRRIGGFALLRIAADEAELLTIVIAPKWRGMGMGAALLGAAIEDLLTTPVKTLFLEVEDGNAPARALYRRLGFEQVGERRGYYRKPDGAAATALVMRRALG